MEMGERSVMGTSALEDEEEEEDDDAGMDMDIGTEDNA